MGIYSLRVDKKIIVVTGGYGHLGKAICESLAFHGAHIIVAGKSVEKFDSVFKDSASIEFLKFNIADTQSVISGYKTILENHGQIDVLVNNAFYSTGQSPENMTDEEWSYGIDGTLNAVYRTIREIIPLYKKQKSGKIINVSSMYGMVAPDFSIYEDCPDFLNPPHYGAAKAGILQLTRYYANFLGKNNVQVNSVSPGPFPSTDVQRNKTFMNALRSKTSLNKTGEPEDLAGIFTFLSSDASNFITGQNFVVDGGWTSK